MQIALLVLPALMETIAFIKQNEEAGEGREPIDDRLWY